MLLSQKEERGRRFTLALRAGIPVLILVFLVFSTTIYKDDSVHFNIKDGILLSAITFITIYFIYFLMNLSVQETMIDLTTQGFNKKTFIKKLQEENPQIVACLTIENLQSLNENYSSEQIDMILYSITHKLNLIFRQHGFEKVLLGRDRGSEFLIALDGEASIVQNILLQMIEKNNLIDNIEINYKYALIHNTSRNFEKIIIQLRDLLVSQTVSTQDENKTTTIQDASKLSNIEKCIISSLQNKSLLLTFRPLLNTHNDRIDIYEIAVKLKDKNGQDILPRIFLPIINRLGLGREYDLALTKHAVSLLPLIDDNISFTFNLSPFSLRDHNFQTQFFDYLQEKQINPNRLIIQLYERKTHHDLSSYLETLKRFRANGLRICIDNFGSSNASMEYMKHFKFDMVQFDRSYVTHLEDHTTYAMLNSLIKMSKDLHIQTVAKWVDNESQKRKLRLLGVHYIQGFGVSNPLTETELINQYN
jgi:EAL domain-containing protein (putative c-di-GMP-specific phosphodiesterase class I)